MTTAIKWIISGVAHIVYGLVILFGKLATFLIGWIAQIASYNHFIDLSPIITGWATIRDVCNMFFVLILLVIAFATILRIENYNYKRLLPKLIIMAVLINFSRTICGLIIDFSQVIMGTFVNSFAGGGINSFVQLLGLDNMLSMAQEYNVPESGGEIAAHMSMLVGVLASLMVAIVTFIVIVVILVVLLFRIVMLWIYVILSPLAFLLSAFPGGARYASQWWDSFIKQVIIGPVLAFFLWLALVTAQTAPGSSNLPAAPYESGLFAGIFSGPTFQTYIITIALLVGGLMVTQQFGGFAGSMAGSAIGKIKSGGTAMARKFSGYGYVADTAKQYMSMRKSARDDRVRMAADKISYGVGRAKEMAAKPIVAAGAGIKRVTGLDTWQRRAKKETDEAEAKRNKLSEIQENIKDKKEFEHNGFTYKYSNIAGKWRKLGGTSLAQRDEHTLMGEMEKDFNNDIEKHYKEATRQQKIQKTANTLAKIGLGGLGLAAGGVLTGGAGLAGIAGMGAGYAAGRFGVPSLGRQIKEAGKTDLDLASNYNVKQLNSEKDSLKAESDEAILATMDDATKSVFVRSAAAMEAMSRKLVDLNTAKRKTGEISDNFRKDKKVMGHVESILEKNYSGATKTFTDLDSPDPDTADKAKRKIRGRYESGAYTMKDMDNESLQKSVEQLALGLKTGKFVKQYKELDGSKQSAVIRALKVEASRGNYKAQEKLAHVEDINTAFGADIANRDKFVSELSVQEVKEIIEQGDKDKLQALKDAVSKNKSKLSLNVRNVIDAGSPTGKTIEKTLEV